ncbi:protein DOG1-like 4 [Miscanthus floridulus]|uniref:protein DOG1-like 4 n=1 Tax=Miscanthus floridulus TaxID=154761 RepID=UPI0034573B6B
MYYSDDMEAFYDAWVGREEQIVADLTAGLALPPRRRSDALAPLVDAAVAHVAAYYEHKSWLADHDIVAALDQHWLNLLERTFLWAWGWKPTLMFRFVETGGVDAGIGVGPEQRHALEERESRENSPHECRGRSTGSRGHARWRAARGHRRKVVGGRTRRGAGSGVTAAG